MIYYQVGYSIQYSICSDIVSSSLVPNRNIDVDSKKSNLDNNLYCKRYDSLWPLNGNLNISVISLSLSLSLSLCV